MVALYDSKYRLNMGNLISCPCGNESNAQKTEQPESTHGITEVQCAGEIKTGRMRTLLTQTGTITTQIGRLRKQRHKCPCY